MSNRTILCVDDEPLNLMYLERLLSSQGYEVIKAAHGMEALKKMAAVHADLVLLDIMMPEMDGIETANHINTHYDVPIIYLTAHSDESTIEKTKTTTPYGYLLKPVNFKELQIAVEVALYKHMIEREKAELTKQLHKRETELLKYREKYHITQQDNALKKELNIIRNDLNLKTVDVVNTRGAAVEWDFGLCYKSIDMLSGDSYSIREIEKGKVLIYIADAMGKGLAASVTSTLSTSFVNHLVDEATERGTGFDFAEFIAAYSRFIRKELIEEEILCVTFLCLDLINGTMDTVICSMPPVLCHAVDNTIVAFGSNNLPFMICPAEVNIERYDISNIRKILAHTDGLNESFTDEYSLYQECLEDDFRESEYKSEFLDKFDKAVENPDDDVTFIFIRRIELNPEPKFEYP